MSAHEEPLNSEQERWLEDVLAARAPGAKRSSAAELGATAAFLDEAQAELESAPASEWSQVREGALVGRILAATTREDLSWRGELRLVGAYVGERLRASVLLRVVAASLILHLAALPVVALWMAGQPAKAPLQISVELPAAEPFAEQAPVATTQPDATRDFAAAAADNARRRARYSLSQVKGPELSAPLASDSLERKLLHGRSAYLRDRSWEAWWDESNLWSSANEMARVLWVELLLDAYVLEDRFSTELGLYLIELEASELRQDPSLALSRLRSTTLDRARAYGLRRAPQGFEASRVPGPLNAQWLGLARQAGGAHGLSDLLDDSAFGGWITR